MLERLLILMKGHLGPREESEVLTILKEIPSADLNAAISSLSLVKLLEEMDDHWLGEKNHQRLLNTLTIGRLDDLSLTSKAKLLSAFQRGWTPKGQEEAISRIILSVSGQELTALKRMIESGVAFQDLHNLIYHDIDDIEIRETILAHFKRNADNQRHLKILSDIDDTIYVNWKDEKYRKKTPYPGMLTLLSLLDQDNLGQSRGDLVFITARPKEPTRLAIKHALKTLRKLGFKKPIVLPGRIHQFFTSATILERKWKNFMEYKRLYPEQPFIFFGDSGQGDADLAVRMLKKRGIEIALIHRIHPMRSKEWEKTREQKGLFFFDNVIDAADILQKAGFLTKDSFHLVMESALREAEVLPGRRAAKRLIEHRNSAMRILNKTT